MDSHYSMMLGVCVELTFDDDRGKYVLPDSKTPEEWVDEDRLQYIYGNEPDKLICYHLEVMEGKALIGIEITEHSGYDISSISLEELTARLDRAEEVKQMLADAGLEDYLPSFGVHQFIEYSV